MFITDNWGLNMQKVKGLLLGYHLDLSMSCSTLEILIRLVYV